MLGKIQEISTKLDKKRVYTAVGALVVALAIGHVMQRNVTQPNVAVDVSSQQAQASMVPSSVSEPSTLASSAPVSVETDGSEGVASEEGQDTPPESAVVTRADPVVAPKDPTPVERPVETTSASANPPEISKEGSDTRMASLGVSGLSDSVRVDIVDADVVEPSTARVPNSDVESQDVEVADVTRAATDQSLAPKPREDLLDTAPPSPSTFSIEPKQNTASCDVDLRATSAPGAMVDVLMFAPCAAKEEVEFDHAGLRFTETLDHQGKINIEFPAMTTNVELVVTLGGEKFVADTTVSDMADYDRVALVWKGGTGLQLHALENGAFYGESGHVWAETPGTPDRAWNGEGGFLTVLGSTSGGYAADVYTYPASILSAPAISIEAQVLETTCKQAVVGEYLRSSVTDEPKVTDVGMVVPDCDAVGEYLVLKNLPQDLTIARN